MSTNETEAAPVAAVDLGSNSFHMIIGRMIGDQLSVVDRLRDPVRLASGLDEKHALSDESIERMLGSLERFGQRLQGIPGSRVRAIGTSALRRTRSPADILARAGDALGYPIEVLSGAEEARLIYLGVCHELPPIEGSRLVADIGGGSTELILGRGFTPVFAHSLQMGCVDYSRRHFPGGKLTRKAFKLAEIAAKLELESIERRFRSMGWEECVGSSGTIHAVGEILREEGWTDGTITLTGVKRLRRRMIEAGSPTELALAGAQPERLAVLAGGVAILKAIFESLAVEKMRWSRAALREGVLYDLLGRIRREDVRDRTIRGLSERYQVDQQHAGNVQSTALALLEQVAEDWQLDPEEDGRLLGWAAGMHEIGLTLAYSGHHKHGAYILGNSDLPGFSRQEQQRLAILVRAHRRKFTRELFSGLPNGWRVRALRLCALLRLAVRLNRSRSAAPLPAFEARASESTLELGFPPDWLESHPLTRSDLEVEAAQFENAELELRVGTDERLPLG